MEKERFLNNVVRKMLNDPESTIEGLRLAVKQFDEDPKEKHEKEITSFCEKMDTINQ